MLFRPTGGHLAAPSTRADRTSTSSVGRERPPVGPTGFGPFLIFSVPVSSMHKCLHIFKGDFANVCFDDTLKTSLSTFIHLYVLVSISMPCSIQRRFF